MLGGLGNNTNPAVPSSNAAGEGTAQYLNNQKDISAKDSPTNPKFGEVWQQIQSKYGAKAEKPREIKKTLGKDDFLRIMITQMKHQDPTKPFDAEHMSQQMAQFASVEQLQNLNQGMAKLTEKNQPMEKLALTNMIGKTVTVDRGRFPHTEGHTESLSFTLPKDAASVKVQIQNEMGEIVKEQDLGPTRKGEQAFGWDGMKMNTLPAKAGTYNFVVAAVDAQGAEIQLNPAHKAQVVGVSFEGTEPVLLVGDNRHQDKITLRNVVRVDGDAMPAAPMSFAGEAGAPEQPSVPKQNFFSFEKGVGSGNLDAAQLPAEAQQALAKYQAAQAQSAQQQQQQKAAADTEGQPRTQPQTQAQPQAQQVAQGFPSGLSDPEQQGPQTSAGLAPSSNIAKIVKGGGMQ